MMKGKTGSGLPQNLRLSGGLVDAKLRALLPYTCEIFRCFLHTENAASKFNLMQVETLRDIPYSVVNLLTSSAQPWKLTPEHFPLS